MVEAGGPTLVQRAAQLASCDVVLSSDPITNQLALLSGMPLVALGQDPASLPERAGVQAVGQAGALHKLNTPKVLQALGLG